VCSSDLLNADLATVAGGQTFNLFDRSGAGPISSFSAINLPALDDGLTRQNDLATTGSFTVVPEPSAIALAA